MSYSTPQELVAGLERHEPAARRHFENRCWDLVRRLLDIIAEDFEVPGNRDILVRHLLWSTEQWLKRGQLPAAADDGWERLDLRVLLYCDRVVVGPLRTRGNVAPAQAGIWKLPRETLPGMGDDPFVGEVLCQSLTVQWFQRPLEVAGGDWWTYLTLDDGSLLVFVADVSGHGWPAYLLASGLPWLWRRCQAASNASQRQISDLWAAMDLELVEVLPDGLWLQATLIRFEVHPGAPARVVSVTGAIDVGNRSASVRWVIPSGGRALGIGLTADESELSFPEGAEFLIATDGLGEQFLDAAQQERLQARLAEWLRSLGPNESLHQTAVNYWEQAVRQAGHQNDDVCIVTVRCSADSEVQQGTNRA